MKTKRYPGRRELHISPRYLVLIVLTLALGAVFTLMNPAFLGYENLMNIVRQTGVTLIVSVGMTFVILIGGIDLSVGSNVAFSGMLGALVLQSTGSAVLAVLVTLSAATLFGFVNGFLSHMLKVTAFIVTLAMQFVGRGATMLLNGATSIRVSNVFYKVVGQGRIASIPTVLYIIVAIYVIFYIINNRTVMGRQLYAIGGNAAAARASGINVGRNVVAVYTLMGLIAGIGAVVTVGRMGSAQPYAGGSLEFSCITAVVLGGTSLEGGKGNLKGTILGSILVGMIGNGLSMLAVDSYFQYICTGLLMLLAVVSDTVTAHLSSLKQLAHSGLRAQEKGTEKAQSSADPQSVLSAPERVVEMKGIVKLFPGMRALDNVDFTVRPREVHALMGENGAGKSTLMRILSGETDASFGEIYINGSQVHITDPIEAKKYGIALIHQEIALVPELTVAQNIYLGREETTRSRIFLNTRRMNRGAQKALDKLGLAIDSRQKAGSLTVSQQQMVEIAKALEQKAWLIIMDEPTSSLSEREKNELFKTIEKLKADGASIVYISHRMQEIFRICDKITILRDGKLVGVEDIHTTDEDKIISMMVGRELNNIFERESLEPGDVVLDVQNLSRRGVFQNISFQVRAGEVLGFGGLIGAGRTEIARCIFGLDRSDGGQVQVLGRPVSIRSPADAIGLGIAYVPEDRKQDGFVPLMSIGDNITMASYDQVSRLGFVRSRAEAGMVERYITSLNIKTTSASKNVVELSGGNQQKVSLANRLATMPKLLILDEPTRGIDIGAKAEIHRLIAEIARSGVAVILISSEMPELIGCADRVAVLREGLMTAMLDREEMTQDTIMAHAAQK